MGDRKGVKIKLAAQAVGSWNGYCGWASHGKNGTGGFWSVVFHRYVQRAKMSLGFATGVNYSSVDRLQAESAGITGATGTQGVVGPQGSQGPAEAGVQGPEGDAGSQGPQGALGLQGPSTPGTQGTIGPQGVQGPQGGGTSAAAFGETYLSGNTTETSISASGTWYAVSGAWAGGELSGFTRSGGVLTAVADGLYRVVVSLSAKSAGQNQDIEFGISINDADPVAKAVMPRRLSTDFGAIPLSCIVSLSAGDNIRLKTRNTGGTANVTVGNSNLSIE